MFMTTDNHFTAKGRLTKEPEANYSDKGNLVTTITLAVETPFRDSNTGKNSIAFLNYTAIDMGENKLATRLAKYVTKGSLVTIEGYNDSYSKTVDGKTHYAEVKRITFFRNEESKEVTETRRKAAQEN
ncbi:single-stranded DNA-binding protein [Enterococcus sp. AZ196]|uniref:single-stranded DNA-binding protein n=1 Tax=Enterococcus sp. AZ196 TaxID=2774659 RepID=UPI003D2722BF